ncbi:hypothetical protein BX666DRAFT_1929502 [Dichotomocladium elegans]|nr:hypothetical protein BX666DRAFT_1929502 [Dichotomocladium elegans]
MSIIKTRPPLSLYLSQDAQESVKSLRRRSQDDSICCMMVSTLITGVRTVATTFYAGDTYSGSY